MNLQISEIERQLSARPTGDMALRVAVREYLSSGWQGPNRKPIQPLAVLKAEFPSLWSRIHIEPDLAVIEVLVAAFCHVPLAGVASRRV